MKPIPNLGPPSTGGRDLEGLPALLEKGTALTHEERLHLKILGSLPFAVETLSDQVTRSYQQFLKQGGDFQKNRYLRQVMDTNEIVFYELANQHLKEMLPILYTPTVAESVLAFNQTFLRPRGLFIAWPDRNHINQILDTIQTPVDIVVMTDGERVLGLGDQGIGGIEICIAKAITYIIGGRLSPHRLLPVCLDVGTNNLALLNDEAYLGWRHERIRGQAYDDFIERVVLAFKSRFPNLYLHWEDFGRDNARRLLEHYQDTLCTFNDDMQGTGTVTLSAAMKAVEVAGGKLTEQRIVIFGAGTAGTGIADQLCDAMQRQGLMSTQAQSCIWLLDSKGLLMEDSKTLRAFQKPYARPLSERSSYGALQTNSIDLLAVVKQAKPTFLIGCSGQSGAFHQELITTMASHVDRPIIFPLSNPTENSEAMPADLLRWTEGRAVIATGSPFDTVDFQSRTYVTSQCNNALVFPGIGLGIKASSASRLTDSMLWEACLALRDASPVNPSAQVGGSLLPDITHIQSVSQKIALRVAQAAYAAGVAQGNPDELEVSLQSHLWKPHYT